MLRARSDGAPPMDFFTGQIIPVAFGYAPKQTAMCSGQSLPINQNQALYSLLGITYGGNGTTAFNLPNVNGRTLVGQNLGGGYAMGAIGGEAQHTLTLGEIPLHGHGLNAVTGAAGGGSASGGLPSTSSQPAYGSASTFTNLVGTTVSSNGSGQPHTNMQPSTAINFAIVLYGIFPSRA